MSQSNVYPNELTEADRHAISGTIFGKSVKIKKIDWDGVYQISPSFGIQCNTMVWAFAQNVVGKVPSTIEECYKYGQSMGYTETTIDDPSAVILFWGKEVDKKMTILHTSRCLTHEDMLKWASIFDITIDRDNLRNLQEPFWSSAIGRMVISHKKDWLYNEEIKKGKSGQIVGAMAKQPQSNGDITLIL